MFDFSFHDFFRYALAPFIGALGAYMAIREDLASLRGRVDVHEERIKNTREVADKAHERINRLNQD